MKVKVDAVPACYALDSAVAIAQGLHIDNLVGYWKNDAGESVHPACVGCNSTPTWHPSGDIKAAWELVKELACGYEYELTIINQPKSWVIYCGHPGTISEVTEADTAPLAITRAFLKARGVTEIEAEWQEAQYSEGTGIQIRSTPLTP
jgi:hypothetical protein